MALNKQIHIYSIDTQAFYSGRERYLHQKMCKIKYEKNQITDKELIKHKNNQINRCKSRLKEVMANHVQMNTRTSKKAVRTLNPQYLNEKSIVSIFESSLTRILGLKESELSTDIIIVETYFYDILKDIIENGFLLNGQKYRLLTASAGQIRTKKTVFIKENLWEKNEQTFMCGLTIDRINALGGININKYLAYLALSNSSTDLWESFDIDRCIVVPDFETRVNCEVDFISDTTYEIERKNMDVPITHTDGCGMVLPRVCRKNFMVRLPWVKGLLASFDFVKFIKETGASPVVTDIYGKKWDIINDNIEIIFTQSQFKMYKYYHCWSQYQHFFKIHHCQSGICNMEENYFCDASINYQMVQTLTDTTDDELQQMAKRSNDTLRRLSTDKQTMLRVFGAVKSNTGKTCLQQALTLYPELLRDEHCKSVLRDIKNSLAEEYRSGKLEIDGKYTFLVPDLYAFCERLFLNNQNPNGLLQNGEVSCRLYKGVEELDCLRSPHLYREHAIRKNVAGKEQAKWFKTDAIYTSCLDPISKILMFDNDGDKSLVVADKIFVEAARRNLEKDHIVPLYYDMKKAKPDILNHTFMYAGIQAAYTGGNIGYYSNSIAKIWNFTDWNHISKREYQEALDVIKILCMENNFCIDMAKTLYMPTRPEHINKRIQKYIHYKLPHFFLYAKKKESSQVEENCGSIIDKLETIIKKPQLRFTAENFGEFSYRTLMKNKYIEVDKTVCDKFNALNRTYHFQVNQKNQDNVFYITELVRKEMLSLGYCESDVSDMLVRYLFTKKTPHKNLLWQCFGKNMVANIKNNIDEKSIQCDRCGTRFIPSNNRQKYCPKCRKIIKAEQNKKYREENKKVV